MQRPAKLAKYIRDFGWEPIILAPESGAYISFDESLLRELEKMNIRVERVQPKIPFHKSGKTKKKISLSPFKEKLVKWLTSWFFLPDNKKGWINPAVKRAIELHANEHFEAILATAPPYSNCLVASKVKAITGLPVLLDFRDDWLKSHWIWYPTSWHYQKMKKIERTALMTADAISVVNPMYKKSFLKRLPKGKQIDVVVIPNGFDPEDYKQATPSGSNKRFTMLHSGRFYNVIQPDTLLRSVKKAIDKESELRNLFSLQFQGGLGRRHWALINELELEEFVTDFGYVEHRQAVQNITNADLLYLTLGERPFMNAVTPGKLFEYMGSTKPILAHVPEGVTADCLRKYEAASIIALNDTASATHEILEYYYKWKRNILPVGNTKFATRFSRLKIAEQFSSQLDQIIQQ